MLSINNASLCCVEVVSHIGGFRGCSIYCRWEDGKFSEHDNYL